MMFPTKSFKTVTRGGNFIKNAECRTLQLDKKKLLQLGTLCDDFIVKNSRVSYKTMVITLRKKSDKKMPDHP